MADFPTYGRLALSGYGEQPESAVLRTEMESGPPKQVMVRSRRIVSRPVAYLYAAADYASWKVWHRDSIARGTGWFNWVDPQDGATKQARIQGGDYRARVYTEFEGAPLSWEVSFVMETWDD